MTHFSLTEKPLVSLLGAIAVVTGLRLLYISPITPGTEFSLFFDEAQYWTWSKALDMGYFSKPPIIAWLIAATTYVCGDTPWCIKLSAPLFHSGITLLIFLTAQRLTHDRTAFLAAIIYLTLPGTTAASAVISSDTPLLFFWALACYFLIRALERNRPIWWISMGIAVGLGLMSKYTMIAFYPSIGLYFLCSTKHRHLLFSPFLWLAVIISLLLFSPNLLWNYHNDFISFAHNKENVLSHGISLYPLKMLEFLGGQFALFGPILFGALLIYTTRAKQVILHDTVKLLFILTFTLLAVAIVSSLISGAQAHWAAPAYISGSILVTYLIVQYNKQWIISASIMLHLICACTFYHIEHINTVIPLPKHPLERMYLWNEVAEITTQLSTQHPNTLILSDERKSIATTMYKMKNNNGEPYSVLKWNPDGLPHDYYEMTTNLSPYVGENFILLTRVTPQEALNSYFSKVTKIKEITIQKKHFTAYLLRNFKGY